MFEAEKHQALITYMRTDSVRVSKEAITKLRAYIAESFGKEYVPDKAVDYTSNKKCSQDSHEAIRPIDVSITEKDIKKYLKKDEARLYALIWNRFVESQMTPSIF